MSEAIELVQQERQRQIEAEGWTLEHDNQHVGAEMNAAAQCYAELARLITRGDTRFLDTAGYGWPWDTKWWKPSPDPIRNLVKAAALLLAEIERLQRLELP